jgi:predicted AAA+ superfamily ATPase
MIPREITPVLLELTRSYPVVTVTGPRQSGKTTLCRNVFPDFEYRNLEAPDVRAFALDDPRGFLKSQNRGVIIDEIQRVPQLLSYVQTFVDERSEPGQFVITGSRQFEVMSAVSQSLAGRTALLKLLPFTIEELRGHLPELRIDTLLYTGFYPRIHDRKLQPTRALGDYFETYVERDLRQLASIQDLSTFERFVRLCAGRIGQPLNLVSLGNDAGISHATVRKWLTLLEASFIVFLLRPWHANIAKRLVKTPKLYLCDVGLAAFLLGIEEEAQLRRDPLRGHLFENMLVMEAVKYRLNRGNRSNVFFYRESNGTEIDLIAGQGRSLIAVEMKSGETINRDFFKGFKQLARVAGGDWSIGNGLLYGGTERQDRSDVRVRGALECHALFRELGL